MFRDLADLPPAIAATTPTESDIGWNTQVTHDGPMYLCDECALKPDGRVYALMLLDLELADPSPWVLQCGRCRFTETIERES